MVMTTVLAGFNIVPIIIFLVVVGKIVKAIKEASASSGSSPQKPTGGRKVEQDLEKFFEKIASQNTVVQETPPPPPVPVAQQRRQPVRRTAVPQQSVPQARPVTRTVKPTAPKAAAGWGKEGYGVDLSTPQRASCDYGTTLSRKALITMLKDDKSIRKAILLREILGPPVAMRS